MSGLDFGVLNGALGVILCGAAMTLFLIALTTVAGTLISIVLAAARCGWHRWLAEFIRAYVEIVRNTPSV